MKKRFLVFMMAFALAASSMGINAYAMKDDGGSKEEATDDTDDSDSTDDDDSTDDSDTTDDDSTTDDSDTTDDSTDDDTETSSGLVVTIPEGLADGTYTGDAIVEPDDDDGFNFYYISVSVIISDGALESFSVSGATGSNVQYSYRAETGINSQLAGSTAGSYEVDAVSMATCSSIAIVDGINAALQSDPTQTSFELGESIYDPDGTTTTLTIYNPDASTDYSDITVAYAVGKFSSDLTEGTDYTVELISESDDEIVYAITIVSGSGSDIEDDDLTHSVEYNSLGMTLDVTVAGSSAGRIEIMSSATVTLEGNVLSLTGGNGETLEDYLDSIDEITITYTDEDGNEVSTTYSTQWQHDTEPEYTADDFFDEDGTLNLDIDPFVYGEDYTYTLTISAAGFDDLTATVGEDAVDTTALEELITTVTAAAYTESDYTAESWAVYTAALEAAEAALESNYQTEIDEAYAALTAAITALTAVSTETTTTASEEETTTTASSGETTTAASTTTASSTTSTSTETGDTSMMAAWLAIFCAAGVLVSGALFLKRRHS